MNGNSNDKTKRSRPTEGSPASSADRHVRKEEERAVRQRCNPADAASSAATTPRVSLMRLAVVERQLIMQGLSIKPLARLASTCKQMRVEVLHKEAGKFIPEPIHDGRLGRMCAVDENHPAHASPLFRQHLPTCLTFFLAGGAAERQALMGKASQFARITKLSNVPDDWTEAQVLQLLAQPWIQSVMHVHLWPTEWLSSSLVQRTFFALPQLSSIRLDIEDYELQESAVKLASKLSSACVSLDSEDAQSIRAIRALPALTALKLVSDTPAEGHASALAPLVWCLPPTLTSLTLSGFSLEPDFTPRSALKAMFLRLPKLKSLHTEGHMEVVSLLQGMLDAGVDALPELRRVELSNGWNDDRALMRRFLHKFPAVSVRFSWFNLSDVDEDEMAALDRVVRTYGGWPRVQVDPVPKDPPPSPHPSDDEPESEVEADEDPHLTEPAA